MRPGDLTLAREIKDKLLFFSESKIRLRGIESESYLECFVEQLVDSIRRVKYVKVLCEKGLSDYYTDTSHNSFDPLKGAIWHMREGNRDEAFWLVFLFIHFGKNLKSGWGLVRGIYGAHGEDFNWDWQRTSANIDDFKVWLDVNQDELKEYGAFGNHRKYQSLGAYNLNGTGSTIESYVGWIGPNRNHNEMIVNMQNEIGDDPKLLFNSLYKSMDSVVGFGRTTKFITPNKALLLLSFRYKSDDQFWFTFYHEAGHLLLHGKKQLFVEMINEPLINQDEADANVFAQEMLIPFELQQELKAIKRKYRRTIVDFAMKAGISPGIVVGQMQHHGYIPFSYLNKFKRRYNWDDIIAPNA